MGLISRVSSRTYRSKCPISLAYSKAAVTHESKKSSLSTWKAIWSPVQVQQFQKSNAGLRTLGMVVQSLASPVMISSLLLQTRVSVNMVLFTNAIYVDSIKSHRLVSLVHAGFMETLCK